MQVRMPRTKQLKTSQGGQEGSGEGVSVKFMPGEPDDPGLTSGSHVRAGGGRTDPTKLSSDIHKNTAPHCTPPSMFKYSEARMITDVDITANTMFSKAGKGKTILNEHFPSQLNYQERIKKRSPGNACSHFSCTFLFLEYCEEYASLT